jgi:hypothetical protein
MSRIQISIVSLSAWLTFAAFPVTASHTADPSSVTIAGSLQSELGCPGDWQPECSTTYLTYDAIDGVWQGGWAIPSGSWEYKAALNDSWTENYGANALQDGPNISLSLVGLTTVKFYYDHDTHWVTDSETAIIVTAPGSYQSELGCAGDWDPSCLLAWLQDPEGDGIYEFSTTLIPIGAYEVKAAIDEAWNENYGAAGVPNGSNISFTVPNAGDLVRFLYDPSTHILSVQVGQVVAIPEPSSVTLMLMALAVAGLAFRRRKHAT